MMISEQQFQNEYGAAYEKAAHEASVYLADPGKLLAEIASEKKKRDPLILRAPEVDQFAYRMTLYRGFAKYPERLKNYVIAKNQHRATLRSFLPTIMDIEPNSRCNFRCIMCQVSEWGGTGRAKDMSLEELQQFMAKNPLLTEVKLHGMGDPFLNKTYNEMVKHLADQHVWVRTSTNASLLHINENYKNLVDAGIGEVQVSIDGATKDVFEAIRRGSHFEQIVDNCTKLNAYANGKERLYTRMWVLVQELNRHQLFAFVDLAQKMGFRRLSYSISLNDWGQEKWSIRNKDLHARQGFSTEEEHRLADIAVKTGMDITVWKQADKYSSKTPEALCPWPFTRPYISCDLRVVPCCMIANPVIADLGDARVLDDVWNGPSYQTFRKAHLVGDVPKYCQGCYTSGPSQCKSATQERV